MVRRVIRQPPAFDCRSLVQTHGTQTPQRVILHTTESPDGDHRADVRNIAIFWRRQGLGYGAHLVVGANGETALCADPWEITWHAGGLNTDSIGIEQVGFSSWKKSRWLGTRQQQLRKVAKWLAYYHTEYGIPLEVSLDRGVCTHAMVSAVYPQSEGHTDPGPGYPLGYVLFVAKRFVKKGGWFVAT